MRRSVYIHIPFCRNICSYCDFCKLLYKKDWGDLYLDKLNECGIDAEFYYTSSSLLRKVFTHYASL